MGLMDKVKAQAEQAAAKAREGVQDVQSKRELGQAYGELGKTAFELIERGEISHAELATHADRIRSLREQGVAEESATTGPPPPPATPV